MPRTPVHTVDSAPEASREVLEGLERRMGKVLNIHGEMAHSPALVHGYAALQKVIATHATFDGRAREVVALAVANADGCDYCQAVHTVSGRKAGLTDAEMVAARIGKDDLPDDLAALAALARAYVEGVGDVPDDLWDAGLAAGWTDAQLAELAIHVTVNQLTNHVNHYLGTELDLPPAPEV